MSCEILFSGSSKQCSAQKGEARGTSKNRNCSFKGMALSLKRRAQYTHNAAVLHGDPKLAPSPHETYRLRKPPPHSGHTSNETRDRLTAPALAHSCDRLDDCVPPSDGGMGREVAKTEGCVAIGRCDRAQRARQARGVPAWLLKARSPCRGMEASARRPHRVRLRPCSAAQRPRPLHGGARMKRATGWAIVPTRAIAHRYDSSRGRASGRQGRHFR